jgi:hypothetical protein
MAGMGTPDIGYVFLPILAEEGNPLDEMPHKVAEKNR